MGTSKGMTATAGAISLFLLAGCGAVSGTDTYTLYRSSVILESARLHVASFDSADGDKYNSENCQQAQLLFQAQPGTAVKFWCEKGKFKK